MKHSYIIILPYIFISLCCASCSKTKIVKYTKEFSYDAKDKFGEIEKDELNKVWSWSYNEQGLGTEYVCFDYKGNIESKHTWLYDSHGNQIEYTVYDDDGKIEKKSKSTYDLNDNEIERIWYDDDGDISTRIVFTYNKKNLNVTTVYNANGQIEEYAKHKYDSDGNCIESAWYDIDGVLNNKYTYIYETKQHRISHKKLQYVCSQFTPYISNTNLIEECWFDADGSQKHKTIYSYNKHGFLTECKSYWRTDDPIILIYSGDSKCVIVEEKGHYSYVYEFDSYGNWIKCIEYEEPLHKAHSISERIIEYY